MKKITFKDIRDLGFRIDEDIHNVSQFYKIRLDSETPIDEFSQETIESELIETNYDLSNTTYSISKNDEFIFGGLSREDVIEFFNSGAYENSCD